MQASKPYQWIASLYFFQSIPFVVVSLIATMIYQQQGMNNAGSTLLTSLLILPWALKPLFAPFLEQFQTKKRLTILMQFLASILFFILGLSFGKDYFLIISVLGFISLAFISSVHDIVSDGVYVLILDDRQQMRYVAFRSFFYQMGRLIIKGGFLIIAVPVAMIYHLNEWTAFFYSLSFIGLSLTMYHSIKIPEIENSSRHIKREYCSVFKNLLSLRQINAILFFIFIYNFSEAQMQKIVPLFLIDKAGLGLSLAHVGEIYGIFGSLALMLGIFISGVLVTRYELTCCLKKLTVFLLLGHFFFLFLAYYEVPSFLIYTIIGFSQMTFGMANGAYMGYLLSVANKSNYPMSMYTICTATMALSYVFFGALSGWIEQQIGYGGFFLYVLIANGLLITITYKMMDTYG